MATETHVIYVCDLCGTENNVESHTLKLDQKAERIVDACPTCWSPVADVLENVMSAGTSKKIADRRVAATRVSRTQVTAPMTSAKTPKKQSSKAAAPKNTGPKSTSKTPAKKAAKKTASRASRKATT